MRVLILNTSEKTGGAAVAANRLMEALKNNGVKAKMLVRDKETEQLTVVSVGNGWRQRWHFLWERWCIFVRMRFSRRHLFEVDMANAGTDITGLPEFREADIIHLHWVNQGFLSLSVIRKILRSGKPVVWTMHDFWPATGICHYPRDCRAYTHRCTHCQYLPGKGGDRDLSSAVWNRKQQIWRTGDMVFVACSKWLATRAKQSALLAGKTVVSIPNPIDTHVFRPQNKAAARQRLGLPPEGPLVLFVSQRITDRRKGMDYFVEAVRLLAAQHVEASRQVGIVILGGHSEEFSDKLALPVYPLGYVSDEKKILDVYGSVDLFVLPSLEDNLPNTVMEAMACGVPCVGFKVGGIPEMIDHQKNGYVAEYRSSEDLARGMRWVLAEADYGQLSREAVRKVAHSYSQTSVASRYMEVYNQAMASKHYQL